MRGDLGGGRLHAAVDRHRSARRWTIGRIARIGLAASAALLAAAVVPLRAQAPAARKRLLVIGEEKGYRHEAVTHAMVTIERLGRDTGLWDTVIRTDTEALTKQKLEYNARNLNDFDAVLFYTGGTLEMDPGQQADFAAFVHDDGKGFLGIHSAAITFTGWPAYGEMLGGYVDDTTLGHVEANWDRPEMQTMIVGAIKWTLKVVDADVTPRSAPR